MLIHELHHIYRLRGTIMSISDTRVRESVDPVAFRRVISHFTSGVAVITTQHAGTKFGVTASAVSSLSMDPPMLLVCLNRQLATTDAVSEAGVFAVNILGDKQAELAVQFATRHPDKFRDVELMTRELDVPLISDALAQIERTIVSRTDVATHAVFMAEVKTAEAGAGDPLGYFRGQFGSFTRALDESVYELIRETILARTGNASGPITAANMALELKVDRSSAYHALQQLRNEGLLLAEPDGTYLLTPKLTATDKLSMPAAPNALCGSSRETGSR
uniref:Putative chlorophenol monooxygenase small subunit n=1 Tax=Pseudarthrobacter chlorophenolicus TaxID=85085 RepID=Q3BEM3_9MICC|nr:putative chlorophenol monooxygenase small subunit [Pseudarthrobacter chlorophenolicus]